VGDIRIAAAALKRQGPRLQSLNQVRMLAILQNPQRALQLPQVLIAFGTRGAFSSLFEREQRS
jgi:hypothetical protein